MDSNSGNLDIENELSELSNFLKENSIIHNLEEYEDDVLGQVEYIFEKYSPKAAFYLVNLGEIIKKVKQWKDLFPNIEPRYAVKCNPNEVICKLLNILGVGFDVASKTEIDLVKDFDLETVIYANPCKEDSSIRYARSLDVNYLVVDSEYELYKIKLFHPHAKLIMRLKVNDQDSECRFSEKFGVDIDDSKKIIELCKTMNLNLYGVSFHVGSSCKNAELYNEALQMCKQVFDLAKEIGNFNMKLVDIGGGFPGDDEQLLIDIAKYVNDSIKLFDSNVKFISEPGRFFVKTSHTLFLNVIGKKKNKSGFSYYMNDGVYGSFNCIIFDHQHPKIIPYNEKVGDQFNTTFFGPTCDSMDKICENIEMPELEIGDWCYVNNFGAYTVASSSTFNGFDKVKLYYILS